MLREMFMSDNLQEYRAKIFNDVFDGDNTIRLDYDLNEDSVVFDVGGYVGDWTARIVNKYDCYIYVYEPVKEFAKSIKKRFKENKKIEVFDFGLSNRTGKIKIAREDDASSVFLNTNLEEVDMFKISDIIKEKKLDKIDVIKINIEGGEYDLLDDLIESGYINKIENIQVQFHQVGRDLEKIKKLLSKTHTMTYSFDYVWENWKLKEKVTPTYLEKLNEYFNKLFYSHININKEYDKLEKEAQELKQNLNNITHNLEVVKSDCRLKIDDMEHEKEVIKAELNQQIEDLKLENQKLKNELSGIE
jgi:FkbM family methyltransferase